MSATATLQSRTAALHGRVDAAFGGYRLDDAGSYRRFLLAHAQALAAAESLRSRDGTGPDGRSRMALLTRDLSDLGSAVPPPVATEPTPHPAYAWGVHYVLEGSRLGGALLARRVGPDLPTRYLGAGHEAGEWRETRVRIDAEAAGGGAQWLEDAVVGAEACFDLYLRAAATYPP